MSLRLCCVPSSTYCHAVPSLTVKDQARAFPESPKAANLRKMDCLSYVMSKLNIKLPLKLQNQGQHDSVYGQENVHWGALP